MPLIIGFVAGLFMIVQFFVPHAVGTQGYELLLDWARIISAFALVLGIGSLFRTHWEKIHRMRSGYGYSMVTLISFAVMVVVGIFTGAEEASLAQKVLAVKTGPVFDWLFDNILEPLDATMFLLLALFIA